MGTGEMEVTVVDLDLDLGYRALFFFWSGVEDWYRVWGIYRSSNRPEEVLARMD